MCVGGGVTLVFLEKMNREKRRKEREREMERERVCVKGPLGGNQGPWLCKVFAFEAAVHGPSLPFPRERLARGGEGRRAQRDY